MRQRSHGPTIRRSIKAAIELMKIPHPYLAGRTNPKNAYTTSEIIFFTDRFKQLNTEALGLGGKTGRYIPEEVFLGSPQKGAK
jgi:hypothetical protein